VKKVRKKEIGVPFFNEGRIYKYIVVVVVDVVAVGCCWCLPYVSLVCRDLLPLKTKSIF